VALGTHPNYRLREGGPVDLLIVSPEDKPAEVLKKARRDHPAAKVFAYLNTMDIILSRTDEGPAFFKEHEDWFLHDARGDRVRVRIQNYHGELARYAMNVADPGWQDYLAGKCVKFLENGYDGVQLDNVETDYSYRPVQVGRFISALPVEMTEERWYESEIAMMGRIRRTATEAGYKEREILFNHIRAGEPELALRYLGPVDGANSEGWMSRKIDPQGKWGWRARVELARNAALAGKRTNLLCQATFLSREEALFDFASYLMTTTSDRNAFWYGRSYRADEMPWFHFYDVDLGSPSGSPHAIAGIGAFRRDFDKGTVLVNPQPDPQSVDLGGVFWDETFVEVRAIEVPGKSAAILIEPLGPPPSRRMIEAESCLGENPGSGASAGPEGSPRPIARVDKEGMSGGAGVEFSDTTALCRLPVEAEPGRYRLVVEGEGKDPGHDAVGVRLGGEILRVAFALGRRQVFDLHLKEKISVVEIRAAEKGVVVDRIVLIRLGAAS